jgi:hypothetical protein
VIQVELHEEEGAGRPAVVAGTSRPGEGGVGRRCLTACWNYLKKDDDTTLLVLKISEVVAVPALALVLTVAYISVALTI